MKPPLQGNRDGVQFLMRRMPFSVFPGALTVRSLLLVNAQTQKREGKCNTLRRLYHKAFKISRQSLGISWQSSLTFGEQKMIREEFCDHRMIFWSRQGLGSCDFP